MAWNRTRYIPKGLQNIFLDPLPEWQRPKRNQILAALFTELRRTNLKPVSKIKFSFDPFHPEVRSIREYLFYLSADKYRSTNPKCSVKTEIVCDRQQPTITVSLENGQKLILNTSLLTTLEIVEQINRITLALLESRV